MITVNDLLNNLQFSNVKLFYLQLILKQWYFIKSG
jgi:hypothetical protein